MSQFSRSSTRQSSGQSQYKKAGFGGTVPIPPPSIAPSVFVKEVESQEDMTNYLKNYNYVVLDIYADWCGPCKTIAPHIEKLAESYKNNGKIIFLRLNEKKGIDLYRAESLPTFVFIRAGDKLSIHSQSKGEIGRVVGANLNDIKEGVELLIHNT